MLRILQACQKILGPKVFIQSLFNHLPGKLLFLAYTRLSQGGDIKLRLTRKMITSSEVSAAGAKADVENTLKLYSGPTIQARPCWP